MRSTHGRLHGPRHWMTRRQAASQLGEADDPTGSDTNSRRIVNVQCVSLSVKNPEAGMRKSEDCGFPNEFGEPGGEGRIHRYLVSAETAGRRWGCSGNTDGRRTLSLRCVCTAWASSSTTRPGSPTTSSIHLRRCAASVDILRLTGTRWLAIRSSPKASEGWWTAGGSNARPPRCERKPRRTANALN